MSSGFCMDLLRRLGEKVNFTYDVHLSEDGSYGSLRRVSTDWWKTFRGQRGHENRSPWLLIIVLNILFINLFIYQLFWTQARPEGMCTNGTRRSQARCHPCPIPQPVNVGHTTGVYDPYSFRIVMWGLLRPTWTNPWKCCETGPTVFRPYPRILESLTICRCHCKGSTFSSVI